MHWKSEYIGLLLPVLIGLSGPIATVEFLRRREGSASLRRVLAIWMFLSFIVILCGVGWLATSSDVFLWVGATLSAVLLIAGFFFRPIIKREQDGSANTRI